MQFGTSNETNDLSVSQKIKCIKNKLNLSYVKLFLITPPFTLYINTGNQVDDAKSQTHLSIENPSVCFNLCHLRKLEKRKGLIFSMWDLVSKL